MPEFDSTVEYCDVPGFPGYKVGSDGTAWSCLVPGRWGRMGQWKKLIARKAGAGYLAVSLSGKSRRYIHRLVLQAFVGPCPDGSECRHLDGNPRNNRLENLCWGTRKENTADSVRHGTKKDPPVRRGMAAAIGVRSLTPRMVRIVVASLCAGVTQRELVEELKIPGHVIAQLRLGRTYRHLISNVDFEKMRSATQAAHRFAVG